MIIFKKEVMRKKNNLYIHIGLRKTATTWLQNLIFNRNRNINYLGKTEKNYPDWLIKWHYLDDYAFRKEVITIKKSVESLLTSNKVNLISSEAFTNTAVLYNQALRIHELFPNAKIIMVLRDPIECLKSHYKDDVKHGICFLNLKEYLDWGRTPFVLIKRPPIYLPDFFYDESIEHYKELFGSYNVCVLKYEDLVQNATRFFAQLSEFLGVAFSNIPFNTKLNVSIDESKIKKFKINAAKKYLKKYFPNLNKKISRSYIERDMSTEIIDKKLEEKLKKYFSGKCYGYY